jgi:hypothetical protein
MDTTHLFLSPGFFGFKNLGSYSYFCHLERGLLRRASDAGVAARVHVVDVHPSASIRRRALRLREAIDQLASGAGPIHLIGHSTGGLDARLVASPSGNLDGAHRRPSWIGRLRSVTTLNTPHFGTPLATFFATVSGHRLLEALSALSVVALTVGAPPLALTSSLIAAFGRLDGLGLELRLLNRLTEDLTRLLDDASSADLRAFLHQTRGDQGAILQLSPEAMDLFAAGIEDDPDLRYRCVVAYAPRRTPRQWAKAALSPWSHASAPLFAALHRLTSRASAVYPCTPHDLAATRGALITALGHEPPEGACDGVVPLLSQVWGSIAWAGLADHLDVVGHFRDPSPTPPHHDWMNSGAGFDRRRFDDLLDAVAAPLLRP